jgi:CheY-like chemotaxis protein
MDLSSLGKNRKLEDLGIEPQNPSVRHPFADKDCTSHIMMVDDEKLILNAMRRGLEMVGLRISSFTRGMDALKAFRQAPDQYDLVITDLRMPEMDGCSFAREILEIRPNLPVILSSGSNEQIVADEPLPVGIKSFMTKPVRLPELRREIRKLLRMTGKA